jgi:hypothetical protein
MLKQLYSQRFAARNLLVVATLALVALIYSCKKDFNEQPDSVSAFVQSSFIPANEAHSIAKIKAFVGAIKAGVNERSDFDDMEVNEAKWVMEASGNYMWNQNFNERIVLGVVEFPMEITNFVDSGQIKMSGTSMIASFEILLDSLESKLLTENQKLAGIDIVIDTITSTLSLLKAKAIITDSGEDNVCENANNDPNVDPSSNIGYINGTTEYCLNNQILPPILLTPGCFFADIYIVSYEGPWISPSGLIPDLVLGDKGKPCTTSSPAACLHGDDTEFVYAAPTAAQFCWDQAEIALKIFEEIELEVFPPPGPGPQPPTSPPQHVKLFLDLSVFESEYSPNPGITLYWWQMCVSNAFWAMGPVYCAE